MANEPPKKGNRGLSDSKARCSSHPLSAGVFPRREILAIPQTHGIPGALWPRNRGCPGLRLADSGLERSCRESVESTCFNRCGGGQTGKHPGTATAGPLSSKSHFRFPVGKLALWRVTGI